MAMPHPVGNQDNHAAEGGSMDTDKVVGRPESLRHWPSMVYMYTNTAVEPETGMPAGAVEWQEVMMYLLAVDTGSANRRGDVADKEAFDSKAYRRLSNEDDPCSRRWDLGTQVVAAVGPNCPRAGLGLEWQKWQEQVVLAQVEVSLDFEHF